MARSILLGLWVCVVTLASVYGGAYWRSRPAAAGAAQGEAEKLELRKVKPITVPVISGGVVKGYVSGEFSFMTPAREKHEGGAGIDPESYFVDEAFRLIYAEDALDFSHIEKIDLKALTRRITANVNERIGSEVIKETFVKNLNFIARSDIPK